eukprot:scaffold65513_cov64-Phaeocystis_antarctica.AAC.11
MPKSWKMMIGGISRGLAMIYVSLFCVARPGDEHGVAQYEGGDEHEADERGVHHEPQRIAERLGRHRHRNDRRHEGVDGRGRQHEPPPRLCRQSARREAGGSSPERASGQKRILTLPRMTRVDKSTSSVATRVRSAEDPDAREKLYRREEAEKDDEELRIDDARQQRRLVPDVGRSLHALAAMQPHVPRGDHE